MKTKLFVAITLATMSMSAFSEATYLGQHVLDVDTGERSANGIYGSLPYVYPSLYWGEVANGKLTPPNFKTIAGTPVEVWFTNRMESDSPIFWKDRDLRTITMQMDNKYLDPFKREEAKARWMRYLQEESTAMSQMTSYVYRIKDVRLKDYNIATGEFPVDLGTPNKYCFSPYEFAEFKADDAKIQAKELGKYSPQQKGHGLCVDIPNFTQNKFPFKSLPVPKEVAKEIYDRGGVNRVMFYAECELKNFAYNRPVRMNNQMIGYANIKANSFASCPMTKLHLMAEKTDGSGYVSVASFQAEYREEVKPVATKVEAKSKVERFTDSAKAKFTKRDKQVIDITE